MSETPIVGIGASAGGVEDIVEFLSALPRKREYSCVVLLHLGGERSLEEVLGRFGNELFVVESPVVPKPGMIYLPKPRCDMVYERGMLKSIPSSAVPVPSIDRFFLDIAYKLRDKSAGVLLSGTGRDGVFGLQAIASNGGETFVKDPMKSRFGQLAQEAIEAGVVDHVGDIADIVKQLDELWRSELELDIDLDPIYEIFDKTLDLRLYKEEMIQKRVARRMRIVGAKSVEEYAQLLQKVPKERERFLERVLIQVTSFFRDHDAFEALREVLEKSGKKEIKVWDVGCSTGEEAYSLAIMLKELGIDGTIFASDINEKAILKARKGCYSYAQIHKVDRYEEYFDRVGEEYCLKDEIRYNVVFFRQDLLSERLLAHLDLIVCRNVLIYLKPEAVRRVFQKFSNALDPGGILFLGKNESLPHGYDWFEPIDAKNRIYIKRGGETVRPKERSECDEELKRSVMEIDALNEELEAMNEELRYANEELQQSYAKIKELYEAERKSRTELEKRIYQIEVLKEEIYNQREYYKNILDSLHSFVILLEDNRIKYVNKAFLDFLGLDDLEHLREFLHDDICSLFAPFDYPDFIDAGECEKMEEIDGANVLILKDRQKHFYAFYKRKFDYYTLILLENITPIFEKKLSLQSMFDQSRQKYTLFQDILKKYRHIFFQEAIVRYIQERMRYHLGVMYTKVAEVAEFCDMEFEVFERIKKEKNALLDLLEFLRLKDSARITSVSQFLFYCEKLKKVFLKNYPDVVFDCEMKLVHMNDKEGLFKELLLLLVHLQILLDKKVWMRIYEREGELWIHTPIIGKLKEIDKSEESSLDQDIAFLIREILTDIYKAKFDRERVVLQW